MVKKWIQVFQEQTRLIFYANIIKSFFLYTTACPLRVVMKWFAEQLGYADDAEFSGIVGLLHDIDFEQYPNEHRIKAPELQKKQV